MDVYVAAICAAMVLVAAVEGAIDEATKKKIQDMSGDVKRIHDYLLRGEGRGDTYDMVARVTDEFGPRVMGSQGLIDAIEYLKDDATTRGLSSVRIEPFQSPYWVRGDDHVTLLSPRVHAMDCLALGGSIAGNVTASVVVVKSFDELDELGTAGITGKIVVYNAAWVSYGRTVSYRYGASRAVKLGALGVLVRSITPYSLYTPHTGLQRYDDNDECPFAAITVEDAELLQRLHDRGIALTVNMNILSHPDGEITSHNLVAEIPGTDLREQMVMFGGHLDSWDVGTGAMDDAGGVIISRQVLATIQALNLHPRRTMRFIAWSSEENGGYGARTYFANHTDLQANMSFVMESDSGTFTPFGIGFSGSLAARELMKYIVDTHLAVINATKVGASGSGADSAPWAGVGVPTVSLLNDVTKTKYFRYHHTKADTMTLMDPDDLDLCSLVWTVVAYVVANLDDRLPRCLTTQKNNCPDDPTSPTSSPTTSPTHTSGASVWLANQQMVIVHFVTCCWFLKVWQ